MKFKLMTCLSSVRFSASTRCMFLLQKKHVWDPKRWFYFLSYHVQFNSHLIMTTTVNEISATDTPTADANAITFSRPGHTVNWMICHHTKSKNIAVIWISIFWIMSNTCTSVIIIQSQKIIFIFLINRMQN